MSGSVPTEHFRNNPNTPSTHLSGRPGIQSQYDKVWGSDATLFGLAIFKNSYGQPSQYIYWGQQWDIKPGCMPRSPPVCCMATRANYKTNIPFNDRWRGAGDHPVGGIALWQLPR